MYLICTSFFCEAELFFVDVRSAYVTRVETNETKDSFMK